MANVDEGTERLPLAERLVQHGVRLPEDGLTDRFLERGAKPLPFTYSIYDKKQTGLLITINPNGRKVWQLQTTYPGQSVQARRKLGVYQWPGQGKKGATTMSLKQARALAAEWLALVKDGKDPAELQKEKRRTEQAAQLTKAQQDRQTFGAFAEKFISGRTNRRKATDAQEIRRMLVPSLGTRPLHEITPRDVRELMAKLLAHAPYDGKNAYLHLSVIFKAAVAEDLIPVSPCASIDKKALFKGKIKPRQRALTDEEIVAFWSGAARLGMPYEQFFKLLMMTGLRLNELAKARWSELNPALRAALRATRAGTPVDWRTLPDEIKTLTVPRERFKSDHEHVTQLTHDALALIATLPRGEYLFSTDGRRPFNALSKAKARLDQFMIENLRAAAEERGEAPARVELPPWKSHDLRRTVRSNLAALRVPFEVAETILGHTLGGLHGVYNIFGYGPQQREALDAWAARLRGIVEPKPPAPTVDSVAQGNVVNLPPQQRRRVS